MMANIVKLALSAVSVAMAKGAWVPVDLGTQDTLRSVYLQSPTLGFAVGDNVLGVAAGDIMTAQDSGVVFKTTNGGATWKRAAYSNFGYQSHLGLLVRLNSISCGTSNICLIGACAADFHLAAGPICRSGVIRTTDGGSTWGASWIDQGVGVSSVNCPNKNFCYATNEIGMHKTMNAGLSWDTLGYAGNPSSVSCLDSVRCYACGARGVTKNPNNASSWPVLAGSSKILRGIHAVDSVTIFAVGDSGTIIKTSGSDTNWVSLNTGGTTRNLRSVYFPNAAIGWAVGDSGTILFTGDGGTNWQQQSSGTTQNLYSVHFFNYQIGFIAGAGGTLLRYDPNGVGLLPGNSGKRQLQRRGGLAPSDPMRDVRGKQIENQTCRTCLPIPVAK